VNQRRYDKYTDLIDKKVEALDKVTHFNGISESGARYVEALVQTIDMLQRLARMAASEAEPQDRKPSYMK